MNSTLDVWEKVKKLLEKKLTATAVSTWFDDTRPVDLDGKRFTLLAATDYKRDILRLRYCDEIKAALYELFSFDYDVLIISPVELELYIKKDNEKITATEDFTFDNFVVGSSNKFAHAAAVSVANNPGKTYNPLFIYGSSGLGKTHLLHAISNTVKKMHPDFKIVLLKGDDFTNELISAIREGKNIEFREKYRMADLFLMDDIQFIAGRESTQEEFFHTFNTLYEAKKQIVMTSDRPPKNMVRLEDRLRTRFEWGLIADIQPPDYETRMAIIKTKADSLGLALSDNVLDYIAASITENVRQLEGTVKKLQAYIQLHNEEIGVNTASQAIKDMIKNTAENQPSKDDIIDEVCKYYSISVNELKGKSKTRNVALARQTAMYLLRRMTSLSLPDIGKLFQDRDHSTVIHSLTKIENLLKVNPDYAATVEEITNNINSR